ncbi:TRAP transporter large permease [Solirhodobacter olei]|uniref:TRAP transporter large permease n=1 Tax=Solirhodobacter olei TaxID=2493082 RepID=UPI000FD9CC38|nr:TRAP transporter large permease [Solirhodobacter olei]
MIIFLILATLLVLLFTGVPIFAGLTIYGGAMLYMFEGGLGGISGVIFNQVNEYLLVAIPLFGFMAHIMIKGRVVDDIYDTAYTFTRHLPGGLAIATILACTLFAAISGSSVATALTIGAVAIPQMLRFGYDERLAYGVVAAGGTLGILIPPSAPMILYGVSTDTSIGKLFMGGIVPGILMAGVFILWASFRASRAPNMTREKMAGLTEMGQALQKSAWAGTLPVFVLGGMYLGVFTATEAAAAGAWLALLITVFIYRTVGLREIWEAAIEAAQLSGLLFMILAGATVFSHVLTMMRVPQQIVEAMTASGMGRIEFVLAMMALIIVLGMFLESIAIILITAPITLPAMIHLHIDPVWYGVLLVVNLEVAMITPPVGMNLFTIQAITRAPMSRIIRGSFPYVLLMLLTLLLLVAVPQLVLFVANNTVGVR